MLRIREDRRQRGRRELGQVRRPRHNGVVFVRVEHYHARPNATQPRKKLTRGRRLQFRAVVGRQHPGLSAE